MAAMPRSVISVSHTDGARGQEVARLVAERLGYRYVDDGIIFTAAKAKNLYPEAVALAETRGVGRLLEVDFNRFEDTEAIRDLIRDAIVSTASEGRTVIVAHAASFALADREDVLRVFVTASREKRLRRVADAEGLDDKSAEDFLRESDKGRESYLKRFYSVGDEQPTGYDLVVNTDRLVAEEAADAIVRAAG
jgi:CMP/dCMP kinase